MALGVSCRRVGRDGVLSRAADAVDGGRPATTTILAPCHPPLC